MDANCCIPSRCAQTLPAVFGGLDSARDAVMTDAGSRIPQVPFDYFRHNLLPPLHPTLDVGRIIEELRKNGTIKDIVHGDTTESRWASFPVDPADSKASENKTFAPFADIADAVAKAAFDTQVKKKKERKGKKTKTFPLTQRTTFVCNPNRTPPSTNRSNSSMPDGYALLTKPLVPRRDITHWDNIVIAGEKKKHSTSKDINDNNRKIQWSMNHSMRETVQRRFVFGYTIENASMRLWFGSRSDLLVSEQFDFIRDHEAIVYFFLSIMFAPTSRLGYDPTITPSVLVGDEDNKLYDIKVRWIDEQQCIRQNVYRTVEPIAFVAAEAMRGRATRVWEGREVNKKGEVTGDVVVVKDCWLDEDRMCEGDILAAIQEAARTSGDPKDEEVFHRHFLHVICHGAVYVDGSKDSTFTLMRNSAEIPSDLEPYDLVRREDPADVANPPHGSGLQAPLDTPEVPDMVEYGSKYHYRIVFKEFGQTIDKLQSPRDICGILAQTATGLSLMHKLGWMHRDISAGNILVIGDDCAKIADLEYSKHVDDQSPIHCGRTGTHYYIPLEVHRQKYLFNPRESGAPPRKSVAKSGVPDAGEPSASLRGHELQTDLGRQKPKFTPIFKHNCLHDLESLWWLSVYLLVNRRVVLADGQKSSPSDAEKQWLSWALATFTNSVHRMEAFIRNTTFVEGTANIHDALRFVAFQLEIARCWLVSAYEDVERKLYAEETVDIAKEASLLGSDIADLYERIVTDLGSKSALLLEDISASFIRQTKKPTAVGKSLDAKVAVLQTKKRTQEDSNDGFDLLTEDMRTLMSPKRKGTSHKRMRHAVAGSSSGAQGHASEDSSGEESVDYGNIVGMNNEGSNAFTAMETAESVPGTLRRSARLARATGMKI
ncbi:hypothetical protein BDW22DRAFT_1357756 [Trametopsis cervina]|nr:hypothetical protein BDW22DRAFT_1357756 [Trametopsis cervina]